MTPKGLTPGCVGTSWIVFVEALLEVERATPIEELLVARVGREGWSSVVLVSTFRTPADEEPVPPSNGPWLAARAAIAAPLIVDCRGWNTAAAADGDGCVPPIVGWNTAAAADGIGL